MDDLDLKILKGITSDRVNALTYINRFDHSLFSDDVQLFGKSCLDYIRTFRAVPTERTLLEHQKSESVKGVIESTWQDLDLFDYDLNEYPFDLEQFKKRFQFKKIKEVKLKAQQEADAEDIDKFYKEISLKLSEIASLDVGRSFIQKSIGDYVDEFKEKYSQIKENPAATQRIKTGFSAFDSMTGGIAPAELIIWGGETSAGKSLVLNNVAKNIWLQDNDIESSVISPGYNVLYLSLEMPYDMCFARFLACFADVNQKDIVNGKLTEIDKLKVDRALDFIKRYQDAGYHFDIVDSPRGLSVEELELRYSDALLRYIPDVVVVDYLGLMSIPSMQREQDWLKLGYLTAALHEFARAYNIPVITAAQLTDLKRSSQSKAGEDEKRVGVHRFGRSSLIAHNANACLQIVTRPGEQERFDMEYAMIKNRNGPLGEGSLIKDLAKARLIDVPYEEEENKDISADIPNLIKKLQNKIHENENEEET